MEREILEYMKYGLVGVLWDAMTEGEAKEALEGIKMHLVSITYPVFMKNIAKKQLP